MSTDPNTDRQLLFGLLALQNDLISRAQLISAFAQWTRDKTVPLDEILVCEGTLGPAVCDALRQMVKLHVRHHDQDPHKSLLSLPGNDLPAAKQELETLGDTDLQQSMATIPNVGIHASPPPTVGRVTSCEDRFRILHPLPGAYGGMGEISVALDEELGRQVALKQILADKADQAFFRQKFMLEAEITGNLEHPGIVPVYGLGTGTRGRPYYAMRLVHGDNLNNKIKQLHSASTNPLAPSPKRVDYNSVEFHGLIDRLVDVAQAIRYAHSRGVLHRDLKPGNILVGAYGETLVIDWGLARLLQAEDRESEAAMLDGWTDAHAPLQVRSGTNVDATLQGQLLGTLGYAPPEQLDGRVHLISQRSDVYALGAILYQILVGEPAFKSTDNERDLDERIKDTIAGQITPPREIDRTIPKSLSAICMKASARAGGPIRISGGVRGRDRTLEGGPTGGGRT